MTPIIAVQETMQPFLTTRPRVLVVDNEPMSRTLMDAVLRKDDRYEVLTAGDGPSGLDAARRLRPDLLLLNAVLPAGEGGAGDGFAVCRTLKAGAGTRRIPVVLVTGQATCQDDRVRGLEAGADDFLTKPFNRIELLARVRSLLRIKALNDQLDEVEDVIYSLSRAVEAREGGERRRRHRPRGRLRHRPGAAVGLSDEDLRVSARPPCCATSARSACPTPCSTSPARSTRASTGPCSSTPSSASRSSRPLRATAALLPIIRHHHERMDGNGYPDGLAGDQIPLGARIVAIADAYDAMTSLRPYRPALSPARAIATLQSGAGRQWDGHLVDLFVGWLGRQPALK